MEAGRQGEADRVVRGGSWNNDARNVRAACRNHNDPANRNNNLGFRPARAHEQAGWPVPEQAGFPAFPGHGRGLAKTRRRPACW
jgi:hypothetical protein